MKKISIWTGHIHTLPLRLVYVALEEQIHILICVWVTNQNNLFSKITGSFYSRHERTDSWARTDFHGSGTRMLHYLSLFGCCNHSEEGKIRGKLSPWSFKAVLFYQGPTWFQTWTDKISKTELDCKRRGVEHLLLMLDILRRYLCCCTDL